MKRKTKITTARPFAPAGKKWVLKEDESLTEAERAQLQQETEDQIHRA